MSYWGFENDNTQTCLDHLGDKVPESIKTEAKQELRRRGYSEEQIQQEDWKRSK